MLSTQTNIYIIGSGAIGQALAVFLKLAGKSVSLIRGSVNDGSRKTERLRVEMEDGTVQEAQLEIGTLVNFPSLNGVIVLTNKSYGNDKLATALRHKTGSSPIVLLQNGIGVEQAFLNHQYPEIYRCVLFVTSQRMNSHSIRFRPISSSPIGIEQGNIDRLDYIVSLLSTQDFHFNSEINIQNVIWKKTILNSVFNSVCPLLEVDNGIFHRNKAAFEIAQSVIYECSAIAGAIGVPLDVEELKSSLLQISRLSDGQEISTLQDIKNCRKTEIETLNPQIVKVAESINKRDLIWVTRLLGDLIKLKAHYRMLNTKTNENI
ncbi:ketopantoate reductase family protein [Arenibacter palladensis]|uniref:ketopantoate reductase family protein n=1 Tax=Arenibacter palladensis TaxID=237373 RepID=UPI0026E29707|nr:2-dehydropantoate 2-reductase [Arenibacter palladensis]MDO6602169.1 2-dehydropantoate 2-reductase [Arenibacter palladensis]